MAKKKFEAQIDEIDALRTDRDAALAALPGRLQSKSNFLAAKAAKIVADLNLTALIPDLLAALDREEAML